MVQSTNPLSKSQIVHCWGKGKGGVRKKVLCSSRDSEGEGERFSGRGKEKARARKKEGGKKYRV